MYESWKIVPLAAALLHAVGADDRQANCVARNPTGTFTCGQPPRPKDMPSERPGFGIAFPQLVSFAQSPGLHGDARIDRVGVLVATRGIFASRRAGAIRIRRQSRTAATGGLLGKTGERHPRADQRHRQKTDNDPQAALLGIICLIRPPAPRRVRPETSHDRPRSGTASAAPARPPRG